jgi:hypothetical protein
VNTKILPRFGIVSVTDPESGQEKTIFLRKKMLTKIKNTYKKRKGRAREIISQIQFTSFLC